MISIIIENFIAIGNGGVWGEGGGTSSSYIQSSGAATQSSPWP